MWGGMYFYHRWMDEIDGVHTRSITHWDITKGVLFRSTRTRSSLCRCLLFTWTIDVCSSTHPFSWADKRERHPFTTGILLIRLLFLLSFSPSLFYFHFSDLPVHRRHILLSLTPSLLISSALPLTSCLSSAHSPHRIQIQPLLTIL